MAADPVTYPDPRDGRTDPAELFVVYLDYFRAVVEAKLSGLSETELRTSRLPSGWTPMELLSHLVHMERRWFQWGFRGEDVDDPWADDGPDGRWHVPGDVTLPDLLVRLHEVGAETTRTVAAARLTDRARPGGRFDQDPPALVRVCFHVLQEYARHVGHLDVVRELADGTVGE